MKAILTIALMAVLMIAAFAVPMALAQEEDTSDSNESNDSSETIILSDDNSDIPEGTVIAPAPEDSSADASSEETTGIAEELDSEENETAGTGEIVMTQVQSFFTFNSEKKVELQLKLAKLRLIQARIAAKNNNSAAMEKALEAHERIMDRVQDRIKKMDEASDSKELNESASKLRGLERAIEVHEARIARLNAVLANANLTEEQRARIEEKISQTENVTSQLIQLNAEKRERIKTRLMAIANLTEEQAEDLIEQRIKKEIRENRSNRKGHCSNESLPDKNCIWVEDETETEVEVETEIEVETEVESESGQSGGQSAETGSETESEED